MNRLRWLLLTILLLVPGVLLGRMQVARAQDGAGDYHLFLPLAFPAPASCAATGARYATLSVNPPPTDRPAAQHADLNLALRGYRPVAGVADYIWIGGPTDDKAPQLTMLFQPPRRPGIIGLWQVYGWNWEQNHRGDPITTPAVTLMGLDAAVGEALHLPASGYDMGQGYQALVLYAEPHRITLKYTREDNVIWGYALHLENICVDPNLLALYRSMDAQGRSRLPALTPNQPFARALSTPPAIAIRDNGSFMDPRSRKDWWR